MRSGLGGGRQSSEFRVYSSAGGSRQGVWGDRWQRQRHARGRPDSRLGGHRGHARSARGTWSPCS
jgi:hypothetical protein